MKSGKLYLKRWREQKWYDGQREAVIQRDGKCVRCGKTAHLCVHHKDWKGRGYKGKINNDLSNLETLCDSCHRKAHALRTAFHLYFVAKRWGLSNRMIARLLNVSAPTVAEIRKEILKKTESGVGQNTAIPDEPVDYVDT